jgi:hypothetical protein
MHNGGVVDAQRICPYDWGGSDSKVVERRPLAQLDQARLIELLQN